MTYMTVMRHFRGEQGDNLGRASINSYALCIPVFRLAERVENSELNVADVSG
jgi:hypothetical protein